MLVLLVLCGCGRAPAPAGAPSVAPDVVRVALAIPSYAHAIAWIADDSGAFGRHRIDAEVSQVKGSSAAAQALLGGNLDLALAGGDAVVKANLAGGDLVAVAGFVNRYYHQIVVPAAITLPDQLKGKIVGLPVLGGPQESLVRTAAARWGLGSDLVVQNMGADYARLAALQRGDVAAITSAAPPSALAELGFHVLADAPAWDEAFPYMMLVARRSWLAENRDTGLRALDAMVEAARLYARDPAACLGWLASRLGSEEGRPAEAWAHAGPSRYSWPPYPDPAGFDRVLAEIAAADPAGRGRTAAEFIDTSLLDGLRAQGRFDAPWTLSPAPADPPSAAPNAGLAR